MALRKQGHFSWLTDFEEELLLGCELLQQSLIVRLVV